MEDWHRVLLILLLNLITFSSGWSCIGLMIIVSMYEHRGNLEKQMKSMMLWTLFYVIISFVFVSKVYAIIQLFVILVYPLLKMYNGKKGNAKWMKWVFYIYYPLHLIIIGILRIVIYGNIPILF